MEKRSSQARLHQRDATTERGLRRAVKDHAIHDEKRIGPKTTSSVTGGGEEEGKLTKGMGTGRK